MENKRSSADISKQLNHLEDEKLQLKKKKNLWEAYKEQWQYLQKREQELLGEVAYLSQGTVSAKHAAGQLDFFEHEVREATRFFYEVDDTFEQKEKKFYHKEDDLNEAYFETKRQEEADNDKI